MRWFSIALILVLAPGMGLAENQTPSSKLAFCFEPYEFGIGDLAAAYISAATDQGYVVTDQSQSTATTNPQVGLWQMFAGLAGGYGLYFQAGHGSTNGTTGEAFENTANGLTARDNTYNFYVAHGVPAGDIYTASSVHGYHLGVRAAAIGSRYASANSIVYLISCEGHTWNATAWPNSRCRLGYSGLCTISTALSDANAFWGRMKGNEGRAKRTVTEAQNGPTIELAGDGATTLTPWVSAFSHRSGTNIPGTLNVWWMFDTPTNQALNPVSTDGIVQLVSYSWESATKLTASIRNTSDGEGYVRAIGGVITSVQSSQVLLNGGRDYAVRLIHGDNPAADIHGVTLRDGSLTFKVGSEPQSGPSATDHYELEAGQASAGPWTTVASSIPVGPGHRSVSVGTVGPLVRLVEVEQDGDRLIHGYARADAAASVRLQPRCSFEECLAAYNRLKAERLAAMAEQPSAMTSGTVIAYTVPGLVSVVQSEIESFWELQGCTFTVVSTAGFPADPDGFRTALKADIASRVGAGASAIFLVGDANDHRQFTGSEYPSLWVPENGWETIRQNLLNGGYTDQSGRDLIPTFYAPDTDPRGVNMGYVTPYWMSDWEYGDVDGDVLPDVPVTRLPVTTTDEVYAYASKLWMNQVGSFGARTVGFLAGDVDHIGNEGSDVLAAMTAISSVASGTQQAWLYESAEPSIIQRNAAAADLWNSWTPEVVFILGTLSNRSWPGGFFDQTVSPPFTMDYIQSVGTHAALVVALSCGGGNFPQTEDGDYGQPIAERFLTEWFKGAIAWVGPTVGSWQTANHPLAVAFAQELFADASRPIASSFLIALRRVLTEYADDEEVVRSALSTTVLGDPLARVNQTMIPTGIADLPPPFGFGLHQNHPNPFNPATRIAYSLTRQGPVSLQVYDASGRLVRTLVNGVQPSGPHVVDWKGENDRGSHVASGPYFCRLSAEDRAMTRKMLLLK